MTAPLEALIEVGVDVLNTVVDAATNKILAFLGDVKSEISDSDKASWFQHVGFASRPRQATAGKSACQSVIVRRSDRDAVIASSDTLTDSMYGNLAAGETAVFAGGTTGTAQARVLLKADGSVNCYTRQGNTSSGAGMLMQLDPANNAVRLLNGSGYGIIVDGSGVTLTAGNASLKLGSDGNISLIGTQQTQVDGATILIGSVAVPLANAALHGPSGVAGVASLKTLIE